MSNINRVCHEGTIFSAMMYSSPVKKFPQILYMKCLKTNTCFTGNKKFHSEAPNPCKKVVLDMKTDLKVIYDLTINLQNTYIYNIYVEPCSDASNKMKLIYA